MRQMNLVLDSAAGGLLVAQPPSGNKSEQAAIQLREELRGGRELKKAGRDADSPVRPTG